MAYGFDWCVWGCIYWQFLLRVFSCLKKQANKNAPISKSCIWTVGAGPKKWKKNKNKQQIEKVHLVWAYVLQMFQNTEKWKTCKKSVQNIWYICTCMHLLCMRCANVSKRKNIKTTVSKTERIRKKNMQTFCTFACALLGASKTWTKNINDCACKSFDL